MDDHQRISADFVPPNGHDMPEKDTNSEAVDTEKIAETNGAIISTADTSVSESTHSHGSMSSLKATESDQTESVHDFEADAETKEEKSDEQAKRMEPRVTATTFIPTQV
jgi:hypothetical protein